MLAKVDVVFAAAEQLSEDKRRWQPDTHTIWNAIDTSTFGADVSGPKIANIETIPTPRVAFVGVVDEWVDLELLYLAATRLPQIHFAVVGPVKVSVERLRSLPNVHFLGKKPHTDVHAYMRHADVNVMCYRAEPGGWWTDIYPLKLHEYLAVGKPVVSSAIDSVREFAEVVAIAESPEDWIMLLRDAIERGGVGTRAQRQLIANLNSWDSRIDTLEAWLRELA